MACSITFVGIINLEHGRIKLYHSCPSNTFDNVSDYQVNNKNDKASDELINTVKTYIDSVRPIGADVTVTTPDYTEITVKANIAVSDGYRDTANEVLKQALEKYFNSVGIQGTVSIAKVGKVMLDTGAITDYDSLTLNGDNKNISMDAGHLPRLGSLEVTQNG